MTVECELRVRDLLDMKYGVGEITFLGLRFGISLRPGTPEPRTTAESRAKLAMKNVIGKIAFAFLAHVRSGRVLRESLCHKILPRPARRDQDRS